uniref:YjbQ family protein n=1 Tax=Fervidicoccus fontis TaxID=683846 RepID=A0A7J3ZKK5_9CREN
MAFYFKEFTVRTSGRVEVINVTHLVEEAVLESRVKNGICLVHAPHATAAIVLNEDEPGLKKDILHWIEKHIPFNGTWEHNRVDDNAAAHIASAVIGSARAVPIVNGRIARGTWQEFLLVELDGPRSRRVLVVVLGE